VTSSLPAAAAGDPLGNRAFWMPFGKAALAVFAQMLGTPRTVRPTMYWPLRTLPYRLTAEDGAFRFEG